jgi:RNA polymerase sigma factor (sigma-70 family)
MPRLVNKCFSAHLVPDKALLEKLRHGDKTVLSTLVRRYEKPLWAYIWNMTKNPDDVCEFFQKTWLRFFECATANRFEAREAGILPFLYRTALNLVRSDYRKKITQKRGAATMATRTDIGEDLDPENVAIRRENEEKLKSALSNLPERLRRVIQKRYDVQTLEEIGASLGVSVSTVHDWLSQAEKKLCVMFKG